jgi:hypothetical protein
MTGLVIERHSKGGIEYVAGFGAGGVKSDFRYTLSRWWGVGTPDLFAPIELTERGGQSVLWIMLNPSTADAVKDDPTVAKCMRLAKRWGFGGVEVRNIFAYRSSKPEDLRVCSNRGGDPTGGIDNDIAIVSAVNDRRTGLVIAAWGNYGVLWDRAKAVRALLQQTQRPVYALIVNDGTGEPGHPLYVPEGGLTPETLARYL